jgi:hypothetical protein
MTKLPGLLGVMLVFASGCATSPKDNSVQKLEIDRCVSIRQFSSEFNARKSAKLIWYECKQLMTLDENYQKLENPRSVKSRRRTYGDQQEYFDDQAWFLVIERMRKIYYPSLLFPEEEIVRADQLNAAEQMAYSDKSLKRTREPTLLPVSPYLLNDRELRWARDIVSNLIYENRENKSIQSQLSTISRIIYLESLKKHFRM